MMCYSYISEQPTWHDISAGQTFYSVHTNSESDAVWAVLRQTHSSGEGYQIAAFEGV